MSETGWPQGERGAAGSGGGGSEIGRRTDIRTYRTSVSVGVSYSPTDAAHWSQKKKGAVSPAVAVIARYKPARRNP